MKWIVEKLEDHYYLLFSNQLFLWNLLDSQWSTLQVFHSGSHSDHNFVKVVLLGGVRMGGQTCVTSLKTKCPFAVLCLKYNRDSTSCQSMKVLLIGCSEHFVPGVAFMWKEQEVCEIEVNVKFLIFEVEENYLSFTGCDRRCGCSVESPLTIH